MKLDKVVEQFLDDNLVRGLSLKTNQYYQENIYKFISFICKEDVEDLCYEDYRNYVLFLRQKVKANSKKLSSCSIRTMCNAVKIFLRYCERKGYIVNKFSDNIKLPKQAITVPKVVSVDDLLKVFKSYDVDTFIGARNIFILLLGFDCGLRLSEIANVKKEDFMLDYSLLKVRGKGNKERCVPISDTLKFYYNNYLRFYNDKSVGLLLKKIDGADISVETIRTMFRKIKKKFGFDRFYPHLLRHSYATLYLVNGGNALSLQDILGHSTLDMTKRYVHMANVVNIAQQSQFSPMNNFLEEISKKNSVQE